MWFLRHVLFGLYLSLTPMLTAATLPEADEPVVVTLPDFGAELRSFDDPLATPVAWWPHVVNAAWGDGRGGPERNGGWLEKNWELVDYLDRSAVIDHDWLTSPLLGFAISQDNIGGPTSRIGAGSHGRYCDFCNAKFCSRAAALRRTTSSSTAGTTLTVQSAT